MLATLATSSDMVFGWGSAGADPDAGAEGLAGGLSGTATTTSEMGWSRQRGRSDSAGC
jgi:hypothetical protein